MASSVSGVFDRWLHAQPYSSYFPSIQEVLNFAADVGGMSSWAHPRGEDASRWLSVFKKYGLKSVEGFRPTRGKHRRRKLRELAASLQLHVTGGSDAHGSSLGAFTVPAVRFRSWMEPMGIWDHLLSNQNTNRRYDGRYQYLFSTDLPQRFSTMLFQSAVQNIYQLKLKVQELGTLFLVTVFMKEHMQSQSVLYLRTKDNCHFG